MICPAEGWGLWLPAQLVAPMLAAVLLLGWLWLAQPMPPEDVHIWCFPAHGPAKAGILAGPSQGDPNTPTVVSQEKAILFQPNREMQMSPKANSKTLLELWHWETHIPDLSPPPNPGCLQYINLWDIYYLKTVRTSILYTAPVSSSPNTHS